MALSSPKPSDSSLPVVPKVGKYSLEFKLNAVRQIKEKGVPYKELSRQLGVSRPTLRAWVEQFSSSSDPQSSSAELELARENRALRAESARLRAEIEFLKEARRRFTEARS